ncbi:uncharacterized protein CLUP02_07716 [Colletotrichum lupini]|uniref:Uncharacterized protein n=1 Tax=Colletotrichum lupini TaxID=145971 RepID=A0A9Q8SRH8_9PEZI|nr:uncharacterized protein CLUP02_07716 [Colletotrichum lupini]KAK1718406.1 hypothetical protein BDP67DRAFT_201203 [Colletotrichum lupini]UQC82229.1 hypothetical protein CLUP02_07716 [Colletotrichum lupini]
MDIHRSSSRSHVDGCTRQGRAGRIRQGQRKAGMLPCHTSSCSMDPGVQDKAAIEVILACGAWVCAKILLPGRKNSRLPKTGRGDCFVKRGAIDDPTGEAIQENKGRDIGNNTHAAPEGANEVETWRDAQRTTVPQARQREREREPLEDFGPWGMRDMGPVWRVC